jgi:hypothetical protein
MVTVPTGMPVRSLTPGWHTSHDAAPRSDVTISAMPAWPAPRVVAVHLVAGLLEPVVPAAQRLSIAGDRCAVRRPPDRVIGLTPLGGPVAADPRASHLEEHHRFAGALLVEAPSASEVDHDVGRVVHDAPDVRPQRGVDHVVGMQLMPPFGAADDLAVAGGVDGLAAQARLEGVLVDQEVDRRAGPRRVGRL